MPMIVTHTTESISKEKKAALTRALGEAITLIPGKTDAYLMLEFQGDCEMAFHGDTQLSLAFVEVKILGRSTKAAYNDLTARICDIMKEVLGVPTDGTYVKYEEIEHWGFDRHNF
ncbi:MAG: hypothetical protein J6J66_00775 [Clostridia bacterium]|nr:hypothetical protein [Clostridia bacterium]